MKSHLGNSSDRNLILISGYYGFSNLGDDAILEELTDELKRLVPAQNIVVLSHQPLQTEELFGVRAIDRWQPREFLKLLPQARLFISGGGGLFQDTTSFKSCFYYGGQMFMARGFGVPVMVYAQGIGPLKSWVATAFTRAAMGQAQEISVRDLGSKQLLTSWGKPAHLSADPVWCLPPKSLPQPVHEQWLRLKETAPGMLLGLSLRASGNFLSVHLQALLQSLDQGLPQDASLVLLPLQKQEDESVLGEFQKRFQALGRRCLSLDVDSIDHPSQWMGLLAQLDMVVGMRLHALIMSLKSGIPCLGIAYDPKVSHVMTEFSQPILNLTKEQPPGERVLQWSQTVQRAIENRSQLASHALEQAAAAKLMACQNFNLLARILEMQSE